MTREAFTNIENGLREALAYAAADTRTYSCNCVGPQNGQPLCPCAMRGVQIIDGRYVRVTDLGPAPSASHAFTKEYSEYTRLMGDERKGE